jgi:hypothetical protein
MVDFGQNFKSVQRRLHGIAYTETSLTENFLEVEEKYRKLREMLKIYKNDLEFLINYEHGGKTMKNFVEGLDAISKKIKEGMVNTDNFYVQTSLSTRNIGELLDSGRIKKFSDACKKQSVAKHEMNLKLNEALQKILKLLEKSEDIDDKRVEFKNVRYDLERSKKSGQQEEGTFLENEYNEKMSNLMIKMIDFGDEANIGSILMDVSKANAIFHIKSYEGWNSVS